MDHIALIKRAAGITWRYRVLWIFGILLALSGSGGGGGGGGGNFAQFGAGTPPGRTPVDGLDYIDPGTVLAVVTLCCCLLLAFAVVGLIVQYVARAALYRMVNRIAAGRPAPGWREGFRLGWSSRTLRLFLLDLIIGIPFAVVVLLLLALAVSPLLLLLIDETFATVLGIVMTIALFLFVILLLVVAGVIVGVLAQFWSREIVLADRSVGEALAGGYAAVRRRLKDVGVLWLLMTGIGLAFGFLVIPVFIAVFVLAAGIGFGLGAAVYAVTDSILLAIAVGLPPALLIMIVPTTFVQGLYLVFESSAWTLAYRDVTTTAGGAGS